jgi:hypothetical protein
MFDLIQIPLVLSSAGSGSGCAGAFLHMHVVCDGCNSFLGQVQITWVDYSTMAPQHVVHHHPTTSDDLPMRSDLNSNDDYPDMHPGIQGGQFPRTHWWVQLGKGGAGGNRVVMARWVSRPQSCGQWNPTIELRRNHAQNEF